MKINLATKVFFCLLLLSSTLLWNACQSTITYNPETGEILIDELPECTLTIGYKLIQGGRTVVSASGTQYNGSGSYSISPVTFDPNQEVTICVTIEVVGDGCPPDIKPGTRCYTGLLDNNGNGTYSVDFDKFKPID